MKEKKLVEINASNKPEKPWVAIEGLGFNPSVALVVDDKKVLISNEQATQESKYSSSILPLIKKLLSNFSFTPIDLKGIILVSGPGSFTGLRVTNGFVQGLAHGLDCPVVSISAFEVYAFAWLFNNKKQEAQQDPFFLDVIIDARLEEFFLARVLCKRWESKKFEGKLNCPKKIDSANFRWNFSIHEEPTIFDNQSLKIRNSNSSVSILKCPNIADFKLPNYGEIKVISPQNNLFLSGWAALLCVYNENVTWKKANEVHPLYVRDQVAQTILERKKNPSLIIESFDESDLDTVTSIEQDTYQFGWSMKNFQDSLNSNYVCRKLINNSLLVGYFIWMKVENECHILNFTIAKGRQRRGLGKWMLSRLLASLGEYDLRSVFLEVRPSNKSAINLYGRNGFEIVGRRKNYYSTFNGREDALVMKRLILQSKSRFI